MAILLSVGSFVLLVALILAGSWYREYKRNLARADQILLSGRGHEAYQFMRARHSRRLADQWWRHGNSLLSTPRRAH